MAPEWPDQLSGLNLDEFRRIAAENRAWSKSLRDGITALVTERLAKEITIEEYLAGRQRTAEDVAECRRRRELLQQFDCS